MPISLEMTSDGLCFPSRTPRPCNDLKAACCCAQLHHARKQRTTKSDESLETICCTMVPTAGQARKQASPADTPRHGRGATRREGRRAAHRGGETGSRRTPFAAVAPWRAPCRHGNPSPRPPAAAPAGRCLPPAVSARSRPVSDGLRGGVRDCASPSLLCARVYMRVRVRVRRA